MDKLIAALHDATHQVPGVPAHRDSAANQRPHQLARPRQRNRQPQSQNRNPYRATQNHQTPPRVLIAWQNWIGHLFGHHNHQ